MAPATRIGTVRIDIDGDWNVEYLRALSESLVESYGLLYPLVAAEDAVRDDLYNHIQHIFWSSEIDTRHFIENRHFGRQLYRRIPSGESLKLTSFTYTSAGFIEIGGVLACILMLSRIARAWVKAGGEILLWEKIDKFSEDLKGLRKRGKIILDDRMATSVDEATSLCFSVGEGLGFDAVSCDTIITIVANPIAALRYLAAVGIEGQKLAKLEQEKLLKLPDPNGGMGVIHPPKKSSRSGAIVEIRRRRSAKPKK